MDVRVPVLAALAALPVACGGAEEAPPQPLPISRNVILISIDTLRADHLSSYGYWRETSPNMDAFFAKGALFEECYATSPWTIPSHVSMLTGQYVATHGVDGWGKQAADDVPLLAERLQGEGFRTGAVVNINLLGRPPFQDGFETFEYVYPIHKPRGAIKPLLDRAIPWLDANQRERFFLFLHVYDVHSDYAPGPRWLAQMDRGFESRASGITDELKAYRDTKADDPWGEDERGELVDLYDAEILQFDQLVGRLFRHLEERGFLEDTLVVITSDHGEEFLEHGGVLHGRTLYDELVHVPLVFVGPGIPAGTRVPELVSIVDIVPTVLARLGLAPLDAADGIDLTPALDAPGTWSAERSVYAEADKWYGQAEGNYRRAVRRGRFKLLYDHASGTRELFDLGSDGAELEDLLEGQPTLADALWSDLEAFIAGERDVDATLELSEEEIEELRRLGYL